MNNSNNCEAFLVREGQSNLFLFEHEYEWARLNHTYTGTFIFLSEASSKLHVMWQIKKTLDL